LTRSLSVRADAINNLSDAGTGLITYFGFRLSSKPADKEHPFGHARGESIASLVMAVLVLILGFEVGKSSVLSIWAGKKTVISPVALWVLGGSIAVKLGLFVFCRRMGKRLSSTLLHAAAIDSLSDVAASSAILIAGIFSPMVNLPLDGIMGLVVAGFILFTGFSLIRNTASNLLGEAPKAELYNKILEIVSAYDGVLDAHDLVIHSYGSNRKFATLHIEVAADHPLWQSHEMADKIERDMRERLNIEMVIHLDPVQTDDEEVIALRERIQEMLAMLDPAISMHDFWAVKQTSGTKLLFDVVVPYQSQWTEAELEQRITEQLCITDKNLRVHITLDRA
jgi:cation diffusion facilitator family transporter